MCPATRQPTSSRGTSPTPNAVLLRPHQVRHQRIRTTKKLERCLLLDSRVPGTDRGSTRSFTKSSPQTSKGCRIANADPRRPQITGYGSRNPLRQRTPRSLHEGHTQDRPGGVDVIGDVSCKQASTGADVGDPVSGGDGCSRDDLAGHPLQTRRCKSSYGRTLLQGIRNVRECPLSSTSLTVPRPSLLEARLRARRSRGTDLPVDAGLIVARWAGSARRLAGETRSPGVAAVVVR